MFIVFLSSLRGFFGILGHQKICPQRWAMIVGVHSQLGLIKIDFLHESAVGGRQSVGGSAPRVRCFRPGAGGTSLVLRPAGGSEVPPSIPGRRLFFNFVSCFWVFVFFVFQCFCVVSFCVCCCFCLVFLVFSFLCFRRSRFFSVSLFDGAVFFFLV